MANQLLMEIQVYKKYCFSLNSLGAFFCGLEHMMQSCNILKFVIVCIILKIVSFWWGGQITSLAGGPLIQATDGTIIGITSLIISSIAGSTPSKQFEIQCFSNIRYHFKWISMITGLKLPQCQRSLRDEMIFKFPGISSWLNIRRND